MKIILPLALAALAFCSAGLAQEQQPVSDMARYRARSAEVRAAIQEASKDPSEYRAECVKQYSQLIREFPNEVNGYRTLVSCTDSMAPEKAREILSEFDTEKTPPAGRFEVRAKLGRLDQLGKPFAMKFTAHDGREVDIAALKGKVVLVDFWATWCCGCVQELPNVKEVYGKLHDKGFEVIGISFDSEKEKLESYVAEKQLPWPEYFDGKGWKNDLRKKYSIGAIPEMWLINKEGLLVDLHARGKELEQKVEKLLAE